MLDIDSLAGFGPFFALRVHAVTPGLPWRPMSELLDDPAAIDGRIDQVRRALAASAGRPSASIDVRVAASVAHLGLVARLVAPLLGATVLGRSSLAGLRDLSWQPTLGGPYPLSIASVPESAGGSSDVLGPVVELTTAWAARTTLSAHVLWGNVASAVHSAAGLIADARPDLAARARRVSDELLDHAHLRCEHQLVGEAFRRRSCCLIYRIAPDGPRSVCGDCALSV